MDCNKKQPQKENTSSSINNSKDLKKIKNEITFRDGSEGSGDEVFEDEYSLEDFVKMDFTDETDLFRYFFRCLKKTRYLLKLTEQLFQYNKNSVDELFDIHIGKPENDLAFKPEEPVGGTNANLMNASNKIYLKISKENGEKRLIATEKLNFGDVLIIEKAIVMTDLMNTCQQRFSTYRCHQCLRNIGFYVTCPTCDIAVFCSYNCRFISWNQYHRWECFGLQRRFWYTPEPQYIALRLMFYGAQSAFYLETWEFQNDYNADKQHYEDKENQYKHIYKLNVDAKSRSRKDLSKILLKCSQLLVYLIEDTDFFPWLCKNPEYANKRLYDVYMIVGGILVKHYIQAELHTIYVNQINGYDGLCSDKYDFQSGGIFLTASHLSHHCKPNAIYSFRENYIIIKAFQEIQTGEEITVEKYKPFPSKKTCLCEHCMNKIKTKCANNSFVCEKCQGKVMPSKISEHLDHVSSNLSVLTELKMELGTLKCIDCDTVHSIVTFRKINKTGRKIVNSFKKTNEIEYLEQALTIYKLILQPSHIFFTRFYESIVKYYLYCGPDYFSRTIPLIKSHLIILNIHYGKYSYMTLTMTVKYTFRLMDFCKHFKTFPEDIVDHCDVTFKEIQNVADFYYLGHKIKDYRRDLNIMKSIVKKENN